MDKRDIRVTITNFNGIFVIYCKTFINLSEKKWLVDNHTKVYGDILSIEYGN